MTGHQHLNPRVIFLFWDGVGYGGRDPHVNPFFQARLPNLQSLLDGELPHLGRKRLTSKLATLLPLNATLRVEGLPQSGTGQASLFTGINAAKLIGRHFGPHPTTTLHPLIESKNIFRQLGEQGRTRCFANAFPRQFFEYAASGKRRLSVSTLACRYANLGLFDAEALSRDEAVSADITRVRWGELGYPHLPV